MAGSVITGLVVNNVAAGSILQDLPGFNLLAFTPSSTALTMLLITGDSFLAGTLPARRASRQNPIDALRYE